MYESVFGLKERAFEPDPDARFHFPSLTHRRAMSSIGFGLNRGAGIIAITGGPGVGKTQLIAHVLGQIDRDNTVVAMLTLTGAEDISLIQQVAIALGLPDPGEPEPGRAAVEEFLATERADGRAAFLVIDAAEHLRLDDAGDLAMLAGLTRDQRGLLQIMIAGEPELTQRLDSGGKWQGVRGRVVAEYRMEPLLADEIDPYIYHRLSVAGRSGRPEIEAGLAPLLYEATSGVPQTVNEVMTMLLDQAAEAGESRISGDALVPLLDLPDEADEPLDLDDPVAEPEDDYTVEPTQMARTVEHVSEPVAARPVPTSYPVDDTRMEELGAALEEQTSEIAALRRELAELRAGASTDDAQSAIEQRVSAMEHRLDQQEQALKHMLGRLIGYFEGDQSAEG